MKIDHFMWGAPSLEQGIEQARKLFGVEAAYGGPHPGMGTHNALMSLGEVYLEIIAPDPNQPELGNLAQSLTTMDECALVTWAAAQTGLSGLKQTLSAQNISAAGPVPTKRNAPDGTLLEWELLFPGKHDLGGGVPFFIDWLKCTHPSEVSPSAGQFNKLIIQSPESAKLIAFFNALELDVEVNQASEFSMAVDITGLDGRSAIQLNTTPFSTSLSLSG
ncbi:MAG: VOC family protein [Pseudomonadota bacterium]